jgi:hypothetical protein
LSIREETESLYSVDDSAVETDALGEFELFLSSPCIRSLSDFWRVTAKRLNSVPLVVRVGLVIGADMLDVRRPCEIVLTGIGERGEGPNLSYGTDLSFRSRPDKELWRGRDFFLPKMLSIAACNAENS